MTRASLPRARVALRPATNVFLICWIIYSIFWTPWILREHFPVLTLIEQGTLNVDRYRGWTEDIFPCTPSRAFINNNPGASLTGAIPLWALRPALRSLERWNRSVTPPRARADDGEIFGRAVRERREFYLLAIAFLTVALAMAPLTAGVMACLAMRLQQHGAPPATAATIALVCGIGTPLVFRAGSLNHNLLVADAGLAALLLLWTPRDRPITKREAALAGLLAGYSVLCDYSGVVVLLTVAGYAWIGSRSRPVNLLVMAAGALPCLAALLIYQRWAFGSFIRPPQHFMPAIAETARGYRGFGWPSSALAWALLFDPRFGLFAYCPPLLIGLAAPFVRNDRNWLPQRETGLFAAYSALFLLFCSANQYSWLQPLTGFRYLAPVAPAVALLAIVAAQRLPFVVRALLAIWAVLQSIVIAAAHSNDIRLAPDTLLHRRFVFKWAEYLARFGAPERWLRSAEMVAFAGLAWALYQACRIGAAAFSETPLRLSSMASSKSK